MSVARLDTTDLLTMPEDELIALWKSTKVNDTTGIRFDVRGWYHALYRDFMADKKVLEVGSGFSVDGITFAQNGAHVTFVDIVESNLAVLRRLTQALGISNIKFHYLESLESLETLDTDYDVIWCMGSLINAPQDVTREEVQALVKHLKPGGRWIELGYPEVRWEREGRMPFEHWGDKTDGGAPWMEWKDLKKLQASLSPIEFETVLNLDFHNQDFNWFDLRHISSSDTSPSAPIPSDMVQNLLIAVDREFWQLKQQLHQTQTDLEQSRTQLNTERHQAQADLEQSRTQLTAIQQELKQANDQAAAFKAQMEECQTTLAVLNNQIATMQTRQFWHLRNLWVKLKQLIQ
ncbi:methyltransferase domain-containing protein [Pantanalinema rosaneae CENA516]